MGEEAAGKAALKFLWQLAKLATKVYIKDGTVTAESLQKEAEKIMKKDKER